MFAASLMEFLGNEALFMFTAPVHGSLAVFAVYRMCYRKAPGREEKLAFSDSLISAGTVANLDPRPECDQEEQG